MSTAIAVITALGVVVAIMANLTNIARFFGDRRKRRGQGEPRTDNGERFGDLSLSLIAAPGSGAAPVSPPLRRADYTSAAWPAAVHNDEADALSATVLPSPATAFIGRATSLAKLTELLQDDEVRLLTIHGPGGIGKSRLAIEIAERLSKDFADGVAFVPLDALHDTDLLVAEISAALGLREAPGSGPLQRLVDSLAPRELLLVLDNFEGLLAGVPLLGKLLAAAPGLKILVTTRTVLRARGEVAFSVPPMLLPAQGESPTPRDAYEYGGVQLFVDRAKDADPAFELDDDNVAAVVEICRRVDGLPLGIELAAARLRTLTPVALLARMTKRLPLLTGGPRDAPARQRTLRDTIAWSHDQLAEHEKLVFARLSVFDGTTFLEAIESVMGDDDLIDVIGSLVDSSLLMRVGQDAELYLMLTTIREFAQERLGSEPDAERWHEVHARYYRMFASVASAALRAPDQAEWLKRLRQSDGNLRAALTHLCERGPAEEAVRLAVDLRPFWQRVCTLAEGRRWLHRALNLGGDLPEELRGTALLAAGVLAWRQGDLREAQPLLTEALEIARRVEDLPTCITALRSLGALAQNQADFSVARVLMEESVALAKQTGDLEAEANSYLSLGNVALDLGRHEEAELCYAKSRELSAAIADTLGLAYAEDNLSVSAWHRGDLDLASKQAEKAMELYELLDLQSGRANVWHRRCLLALERGRLDEAEFEGNRALAVRLSQGEDRAGAFVLYDLARVSLARRNAASARDRLARGIAMARPQGAPVLDMLFVEGTVAYLSLVGNEEDAYLLQEAAKLWRTRLAVPVAPVNHDEHRRLEKRLNARLSATARAGLVTRAAALSVTDLLELTTKHLS